jgi:hypothetical protein
MKKLTKTQTTLYNHLKDGGKIYYNSEDSRYHYEGDDDQTGETIRYATFTAVSNRLKDESYSMETKSVAWVFDEMIAFSFCEISDTMNNGEEMPLHQALLENNINKFSYRGKDYTVEELVCNDDCFLYQYCFVLNGKIVKEGIEIIYSNHIMSGDDIFRVCSPMFNFELTTKQIIEKGIEKGIWEKVGDDKYKIIDKDYCHYANVPKGNILI